LSGTDASFVSMTSIIIIMNYKVLKKQAYQFGNFQIVPIRFQDKYDIMKWRNEQIYHLRQQKPLTEADQNLYFDTVVSKLFDQEYPNQILFSYLEGEKCIGYGGLVHINWVDKNAEISFIMATNLEQEFFKIHWVNYLNLIEKAAFQDLNLHKLYTYAFDIRPHLYEAIESAGFKKEAILKEHCFFEENFKNVIIHSKINE
jgi:RimJ/RimL family protein N-acetyltransferase